MATCGAVGTCAHSLHEELLRLRRACSRLWSTNERAPEPWAIYTRRWAVPLPPVYRISLCAERGVHAVVARLRHRTQPPIPEAALIPEDRKAFRLSRHGETGPDVKAGAASGVRWSSLSTIALIVANVAYSHRFWLISPSAFGLMALANLVVLFLQFFTRLGLSALVQKTRP